MKKEILILGTICLFIGVGIQPAFAVEITNNKQSENIEDCDCQVDEKFDIIRLERLFKKIDSLLDRVEIFTDLMPLLSKDNPKVIKDCEELSDGVKDLSIRIDELTTALSGQDNPIICGILLILYNTFSGLYEIIGYIILNYRTLYLIFFPILFPIGITIASLMIIIYTRGLLLNCEGFHLP